MVKNKITQLIPKPKSKYSYCSVCKVDYNDYCEVSSPLFSIFKLKNTKSWSETTDLMDSSTIYVKNSDKKQSLNLSKVKKKFFLKLLSKNCLFLLKRSPPSISIVRLNHCRTTQLDVNTKSSMAGSKTAKLSNSFLMLMITIYWEFLKINSEWQQIHLFLQ